MAHAVHVALAAHPDNPVRFGQRIDATLKRNEDGGLTIAYAIHGLTLDLRIPSPQAPAPDDALWRTTCCELFIGSDENAGYREFNFSPSGQWAAYDFSAYRQRLHATDAIPAPSLQSQRGENLLKLDVTLPAAALPSPHLLRLGVSVVLAANDGYVGYWALRHAPGKPDFHHPTAFALTLGTRGFNVPHNFP